MPSEKCEAFISSPLDILYVDEHMVAIDKPSGFHVHPHEQIEHRVSRDLVCLYLLRKKMKRWVYPVHRLDVGTSGVLLFALDSETAGKLCEQFYHQQTEKIYHAVVRGYTLPEGLIDCDLELDSTNELVPAKTKYKTLAQIELPFAVGKRHPTSRYSLIEAKPLTGRFHQIRRHFNRISHPLLGDAAHGDSHHNKFFREQLGIRGLCLRAQSLSITHPWTADKLTITAPKFEKHSLPANKWEKIYTLFSFPAS